jgi:hypothetical protein
MALASGVSPGSQLWDSSHVAAWLASRAFDYSTDALGSLCTRCFTAPTRSTHRCRVRSQVGDDGLRVWMCMRLRSLCIGIPRPIRYTGDTEAPSTARRVE